ncbi:MAG: hypothetical protein L6W00_17120 [Lentisphaeria bacterium]|nr:MAG: hypothetical protein L6W00_17120 [Lentisphaeria bacterium]
MRSSTPSATWDGALTPIHGTSCNVLFVDGHVYAVPGRSSPAIYAHKLISTENADDNPLGTCPVIFTNGEGRIILWEPLSMLFWQKF